MIVRYCELAANKTDPRKRGKQRRPPSNSSKTQAVGKMYGTIEDEQTGETFCKPHRRALCHECCCDFRGMNAYARDEIEHEEITSYGEDPFEHLLRTRMSMQARWASEGGFDERARRRAEALLRRQQHPQAQAPAPAARNVMDDEAWLADLPSGRRSQGGGGSGKKKRSNKKKGGRGKGGGAATAATHGGAARAGGSLIAQAQEAQAKPEDDEEEGEGSAGDQAAAPKGREGGQEEEEEEEEEEEDWQVRDDECIICYYPLATKEVLSLVCGHPYHTACVLEWRDETAATGVFTCPKCRSEESTELVRQLTE